MKEPFVKFTVVLLTVLEWIFGIIAALMPVAMYIYTIYAAYKIFLDSIVAAIVAAILPILSTIGMMYIQWKAFGFIGFCSDICILIAVFLIFGVIAIGLSKIAVAIMDRNGL